MKQFLHQRPVLAGAVLFVVCAVVFLLWPSASVVLHVSQAPSAAYEIVKNDKGDDEIMNHLIVELENRTGDDLRVAPFLPNTPENKGSQLISALSEYQLPSGGRQKVDLYVRFPKSRLQAGQGSLKVGIQGIMMTQTTHIEEVVAASIIGPKD